MNAHAARSRWIALFALLLVAATALFVFGVMVERSQGHTETTSSSTETNEHPAGEAGESNRSEETGGRTPDNRAKSEEILGLDTESTPVVTVAVLIALLLAASVWWRPRRELLLVAILFCLGAAALDVREVRHQLDENRDAVALLASAVAVLHLAAAGAGGAALRAQVGGPSATPAAGA